MGRDEQWRQAYEWMRRYGYQTPDARMRSLYDPPSFRRLPRWASHWEPTPMPDIHKILDFKDMKQYINGSIQGSPPDLSARQTIDDIERTLMATFDDPPDSFSGQVGQRADQKMINAELKKVAKLFPQGPFGPPEPRSHARYVDQDGEQHVTEILEDTDELCPCGATWRHDDCEHT